MKRMAAVVAFLSLTASVSVANAYSIEPSSQPPSQPAPASPTSQTAGSTDNLNLGSGLQSLSAPFENFVNNVRSINSTNLNLTPGTPNVPPIITASAQSWFQQFDSWLYGIIGFHIGDVLNVILQVFAWILGIVKDVVDWLLSVIR